MSSAAGDSAATRSASTATCGVTRCLSTSSDSAATTVPAPYSASRSTSGAAEPGAPTTTATGSPSERAAVSSSRLIFLTVPSACSTRTRTDAIALCLLEQLLGGEEVGDLHAAQKLL